MMDNLENVVVTFQKTLLVMLEKIEKLESLEKSSRGDTAPNKKGSNTEEMKQLTNAATTLAEMPASAPILGAEMKRRISYLEIKFVLGLVTLVVGLIAADLALFHWVERTGVYHLLGDYARYVCAYGGFAAMIFGAMLINDFLVLRNVLKEKYVTDKEITVFADVDKEEEKKGIVDRGHKNRGKKIAAIPLAIILFMLCPMVISSTVSHTATVFITPKLETAKNEYVWISCNDGFVRKLNKSDPGGTEILSWGTNVTYPFGCEYRFEDGYEYVYIVNYHGAQADILIKFHANNGTEVSRWDISGYSGNAYGLAWNGSRWFIADSSDNKIYQVDPADPTVQERNFTYTGISVCEGLAWDGSYLWAADSGTDTVYQIDVYGNIQTSWNFTPNDPTGIAYDTTSGHLWIVESGGNLYEYYTNGTQINSWDLSGANPEGVAYAFADA